jgi:DNA-binding transcriptional ArsR family regulator
LVVPLTYNYMVVSMNLSDADVDRIFQALSDRTRRDILERAIESEQSVSAMARQYDMSFAAVQKHVAVLDRAGLVTKSRHGREQLVRTDMATVHAAQGLLDEFETVWRARIDRFTNVLTTPSEGATP